MLDLEPRAEWAAWGAAARSDYLTRQQPPTIPGDLQMGEVVGYLREQLPPGAIITNGAGNYATWAHRFLRWRRYGTQLAPTSGAMGYGVPAAVAAKLRHPESPVVCFAGDGCFLMNGQELATAVAHRLGIVFLVINNGMLGTIRMHQELRYPGRVSGTSLTNPDFVTLANAYGARGARIETFGQFRTAWEAARPSATPLLLELVLDPRAITPDRSL